MKIANLRVPALVVFLFLGVYVLTFAVVSLVKPTPQITIPLVIGLSFALALLFIYFLSSHFHRLSQFGFNGSDYRYLWVAIGLGLSAGSVLTFMVSRFDSSNPMGDVSLRPWMIFLYFIIGAPIQEEVIFRGLLQTILGQRYGTSFRLFGTSISFAALFIALLFGLIHLVVGVATATAAFALGLLAGELRRRSSSLLPAIVLHAIFNGFSAIW